MKLIQAFNKKEQVINYNEAMEGWEYSCPICRHIVRVNKKDKCFNHENTEQDDICGSKYATKQDDIISKKYKKESIENENVVEKVIIEKEKVLQTDIKIKIKEESGFTEKQSKAYDMFFGFLNDKNKNMFVLAGYSGTGKTYLISRISKVLNCMGYRFTTATFTGKASSVLRSRGVESDTIHSLMYKPIIDEDTGNIQGWTKNGNLPYNLIFIDEYSMLTEEIINDLLSYNIKICFAGDKFQLPPVGMDCNYLDDKVNIELTEIVRQAEGNPIIKWATHIRNGNFLDVGIKEKTEQGLFMTINSNDTTAINAVKDKVNTIICGTNDVRHRLNLEWRIKNKLSKDLVVGEEIIILKNNKCFGLYNGETIKISKLGEIYTDKIGLRCMNIEVEEFGIVKICYENVLNPDFNYNNYLWNNKHKKGKNYIEPLFTNSAIAITSHRAQGSQYESVLVFAKDMEFMMKRNPDKDKGRELWLRAQYTAITRGIKNCIVVI